MKAKQTKWMKFLVAVFVTLSLAFLPMLSQQSMAGHHGTAANVFAATMDNQEHVSGSCAEKSQTGSSDLQMDCCDMSCSSFAAFDAADVPAADLQMADHFGSDAVQLTSRTTFGLLRPPRVLFHARNPP